MREGQVFNGRIIQINFDINFFINDNWGFGNVFKKRFILRFELYSGDDFLFKDFTKPQVAAFFGMIDGSIPKRSSLKKKCITNLFVLDMINSYKGWRHFKGLPTRGQRT